MSQSAKQGPLQETSRRGRAASAGVDALGLAAAVLKRAGFPDSTLVLRWAAIAGDEVARIAQPVKYQEGPHGAVLTLRCEPAASVFLQHETRGLTERVNRYLGAGRIARIRLVPGPVERPLEPARRRPPPPQAEPPRDLAQALNRLGALRRSLRPDAKPATPD